MKERVRERERDRERESERRSSFCFEIETGRCERVRTQDKNNMSTNKTPCGAPSSCGADRIRRRSLWWCVRFSFFVFVFFCTIDGVKNNACWPLLYFLWLSSFQLTGRCVALEDKKREINAACEEQLWPETETKKEEKNRGWREKERERNNNSCTWVAVLAGSFLSPPSSIASVHSQDSKSHSSVAMVSNSIKHYVRCLCVCVSMCEHTALCVFRGGVCVCVCVCVCVGWV